MKEAVRSRVQNLSVWPTDRDWACTSSGGLCI